MPNHFLVTTALEDTWPDNSETPTLFLGEWCRIYTRKDRWSKMNAEVLPYHWDNREKLFKDYQYLSQLYEVSLQTLQKQLNKIHGVDYSLRYWRILIGPWLGYFIQVLFDRWFMLRDAVNNNQVNICRVLERESISYVANDMRDFNKMFITDEWNEVICSQLINLCWNDKITIEIARFNSIDVEDKNYLLKKINSIKRSSIETAILFLNKLTVKNNDHFFISSYLPLKSDFKLQLSLGQFPKLWRQQNVPTAKPDFKQRKFLLGNSNLNINSFESILFHMIPKHIPTDYLEGYKKLSEKAKSLSWPKNPKSIFTSNSYLSDDLFKIWAAEKTEFGVPILIGQHGGHLGMSTFAFDEEHQIEISDKWLSWGWSDNETPHVTPVGNLKIINNKGRYNPNGGAIMVQMALPRYSYHLYAVPISKQYLDYLNNQFTFVASLPEEIRNQLTVRLFPTDFNWKQKQRWSEIHPNVKLDFGKKSIKKLLAKSRIYISTYNATTFLESFAMDIPTIMFWNPNHWELRESAKPYFEELRDAGVFHETPKSAAEYLTSIWDDIESWWSSYKVKQAVKVFCGNFNMTGNNVIKKIEKELINLEIKKSI